MTKATTGPAAGSETGLLFDFDDVPPNCFQVLANGAVVGRIMRVIQYRRATGRCRMV
jgi:hypothetical protein